MSGDHPTDWAVRYVKAEALREAADDLRGAGLDRVRVYLYDRADEIEET